MSSRLPGQKQGRRAGLDRRRDAADLVGRKTPLELHGWLGEDRLFTPMGYEPGYDYPLLVWLRDESTPRRFDLARVMTRVSLRNFIAVQPMPETAAPPTTSTEEMVWRSIDRVCERLSIHGRRIFLVGHGHGGTEAFRIACRYPEAFGGVVSLGGPFPLDEGLFARIAELRRLPMLLCCRHGRSGGSRAAHVDRTLRLFHAAGASLAMRIYPDRSHLAPCVLADVNRWLMDEVCGTPASVPTLSTS